MEHAVVKHPTKRSSGPDRKQHGWRSRRGIWTDGGLVSHATGRVFFTLDGVEYACSAAVVAGVRADVVLTAAHCVSDGSGGWAQNWTFIPWIYLGTAALRAVRGEDLLRYGGPVGRTARMRTTTSRSWW